MWFILLWFIISCPRIGYLISIRWSQSARTKVDTFVEFPLSGLDMSSYLIRNLSSTRYSNANSCLYDLAAVIVHHGNGMGSGMRRGSLAENIQIFILSRALHCICYQQPGLVQLQRCKCEGDRLSECAELQGLHPVLRPEGLQQSDEQLRREEDVAKH